MRSLFLLAAAASLVACGEGGSSDAPARPASETPPPAASAPVAPAQPASPDPQSPPARPVLADGAALFRGRCVMCHGEAGDGNGQLAGALDPRPRDFRRGEWQESVSDARIETVISQGGPSVGLSPIMPAQPDLDPGQLASLRAYVRSLAR